MSVAWLLDVAPEPPPVIGPTSLAVLVLMVFALAAILIAGFVYLLIRIKRKRRLANEKIMGAQSMGINSPN